MSEDTKSSKFLGHRRQPAIGKAMPVTALLLNFTNGNAKPSHSRGGGNVGHLPEFELPPRYFNIDESQDDTTTSSNDDDDDDPEQAYELLVSECSSNSSRDGSDPIKPIITVDNNGRKNDSDSEDENPHKMSQTLLGNNTNFYTPCLTCTGNAPPELRDSQSAINEMCRRLCTDECRLRLSLAGFVPPIKSTVRHPPLIHPQRKKFLTDLQRLPVSDTDSDLADESQSPCPERRNVTATNNKSLGNDFLPREIAKLKDLREQYEIAEALAKTSALTSTSRMKQRLAVRKLEIDLESEKNGSVDVSNDLGVVDTTTGGDEASNKLNMEMRLDAAMAKATHDYVPPRDLLLYLVRMGSFNSAPKINNVDSQDDNMEVPEGLSIRELLLHLKKLHGLDRPPLLSRSFQKEASSSPLPLVSAMASSNSFGDDLTDSLRCLDLNVDMAQYACNTRGSTDTGNAHSTNDDYDINDNHDNQIRIFQWNILSQTLGQHNDGFVRCPEEALMWDNRKFLIAQEILQQNPDVICLQEVDHFKFLNKILDTQQYEGIFFPKPDSPCLYIEDNNGPDGCAIFYKRNKFQLKSFETRVLEVWRVQSNQVAIAVLLQVRATGKEFCVCTTHLKARRGSLLAKLRNEQGRDLIRFVKNFSGDRPVLLCGDFNAEPVEPIYTTILNCDLLNLSSAYADFKNDFVEKSNSDDVDFVERSKKREPPYTTWKIREQGEECHTIDYVFYTWENLKVKNCLDFPKGDEIGINRTPSLQYPSDHFSLVCDFVLVDEEKKTSKDEISEHCSSKQIN